MRQYTVDIYVRTSIRGPFVGMGKYAAIVECMTSRGSATRSIYGMETETTYYRLVLLAIVKALEMLNTQCSVTVHTECEYIKNIAERGSPEAWRRSEWIRPSGREVKNKEMWRQYLELADKHIVGFAFNKTNKYDNQLIKILGGEKCLKNLEN